MKWYGLKDNEVVAEVIAPDKATAERYLGYHTKTKTILAPDVVMSSLSYEEHRRVQQVVARDHKPVKFWSKSK